MLSYWRTGRLWRPPLHHGACQEAGGTLTLAEALRRSGRWSNGGTAG